MLTTRIQHSGCVTSLIRGARVIMDNMDVRPSVQRKALLVSYFTGPVAIVLVLVLGFFMVATRPPSPVDTYKALTEYNRAEYFARQYLLVWLAGSNRLSDRLAEMTSVGENMKLDLNPDPMSVTDINVTDVLRFPTDNPNETEWSFTLAASTIPPGSSATRNYYYVTFVEHEGAFQVITLPRLTTATMTPIKVNTVYTQKVALDGSLGKMLANFVQAFLIPGASGNLGRYVSESFQFPPITGAPYTSVRITALAAAGDTSIGGKEVSTAQPGDAFDVLVTVKTSVSTTTYTTQQLPLRVHMTPNGQWLVDTITSPVDFGAVSNR